MHLIYIIFKKHILVFLIHFHSWPKAKKLTQKKAWFASFLWNLGVRVFVCRVNSEVVF